MNRRARLRRTGGALLLGAVLFSTGGTFWNITATATLTALAATTEIVARRLARKESNVKH